MAFSEDDLTSIDHTIAAPPTPPLLSPIPSKRNRLSVRRKTPLRNKLCSEVDDMCLDPDLWPSTSSTEPKMAFSEDLTSIDHTIAAPPSPPLLSPIPSKRSRLSLPRKATRRNKPCYEEDDSGLDPDLWPSTSSAEPKPKSQSGGQQSLDVEVVDLTSDVTSDAGSSLICGIDLDTPVWTLGLPNCGNTCYVNSILQVLRYSPNFLSSVHFLLATWKQLPKAINGENEAKEFVFFQNLHMLYTAMRRKEVLKKINMEKDYCPYLQKPVQSVVDSLREISSLFEEGEQHDAHELLITILSNFSTTYQMLKNQVSKREVSSPDGTQSTLRVESADPQPLMCDGAGDAPMEVVSREETTVEKLCGTIKEDSKEDSPHSPKCDGDSHIDMVSSEKAAVTKPSGTIEADPVEGSSQSLECNEDGESPMDTVSDEKVVVAELCSTIKVDPMEGSSQSPEPNKDGNSPTELDSNEKVVEAKPHDTIQAEPKEDSSKSPEGDGDSPMDDVSVKKVTVAELHDTVKADPAECSPKSPECEGGGDTPIAVVSSKKIAVAKRRNGTSKLSSLDLSSLETLEENLGLEGKIRYVVQCLECEKRLEREESFTDLEVNFPETDTEEEDDKTKVFNTLTNN